MKTGAWFPEYHVQGVYCVPTEYEILIQRVYKASDRRNLRVGDMVYNTYNYRVLVSGVSEDGEELIFRYVSTGDCCPCAAKDLWKEVKTREWTWFEQAVVRFIADKGEGFELPVFYICVTLLIILGYVLQLCL